MRPFLQAWPRQTACRSLFALGAFLPLSSAVSWSQSAIVNTSAGVVAGRVLNALSGLPVPRVLVQLGSRAVLTDHEGRFSFLGASGDLSSLQITKPGYALSAEQLESSNVSIQISSDPSAMEIQIFPEAVLTGTLLGPDGAPLSNLFVTVRRSLYTETGHYVIPAAHVRTNSQGNFRAPVPAGDYVVQTDYIRDPFETDRAILPQSIPASSLAESEMVHVRSGEEVHLDFHPLSAPLHKVTLDLDASGRQARLSIHSTSGYAVPQVGGGAGGRGRGGLPATVDLPSGTFLLESTIQTPSGEEKGQTVITVADHDTTAGPLHYSAAPNIPIELTTQTSTRTISQSASSLPPTTQQLGLSLRSLGAAVDGSASYDIQPVQLPDHTTVFRVAPGRYRIHTSSGTAWFIESANFGSSNVLQDDVVLGPGVGASPLRLVVSDQTGSIAGTVRLLDHPASVWIYLIATNPSASPISLQHSNSEGAFTFPHVAPGAYLAVAFEHKHSADLLDPKVIAAFASRIQTVPVLPGARASLTLDAVPARELLK